MNRRDLTYEENNMVLESHMFLKQKIYGNIKGQKVSGDNKQYKYITK